MQRSLPLLTFIVFAGLILLQNFDTQRYWYSPFVVTLAVIILAALSQQAGRDDDL